MWPLLGCGMRQRRQERRTARKERREERRTARKERREERQTGRAQRRELRQGDEQSKPSSTPAWRVVVPLVCSTQPCRSSVARPARSSTVLTPFSPKATSIGGLIPAIPLSAASTPSSRHLEVSASPARSAGAPAWTGLAAFLSQKNMAIPSYACAPAPKVVPGTQGRLAFGPRPPQPQCDAISAR